MHNKHVMSANIGDEKGDEMLIDITTKEITDVSLSEHTMYYCFTPLNRLFAPLHRSTHSLLAVDVLQGPGQDQRDRS